MPPNMPAVQGGFRMGARTVAWINRWSPLLAEREQRETGSKSERIWAAAGSHTGDAKDFRITESNPDVDAPHDLL